MTLPRFDFNDFPIETDQAQIEVIFPVGRHVLELVVEDSAGLQSAPSTVVITVEQAPPVINQIQPNSGQQGETVQAQISGENLLGISEVSFAGSGVSATILPGGSNTSVSIEMIISPQATTGSHNFTITTPGGTATSPAGVEFMVTPAVAPVITIRPASGPVGTTVNIEGAGFAPSSQVSITFDSRAAGAVTSDDRGAWASLVLVSEATLGDHLFTATDANGNSASAPFRVEPVPPVITGIVPDRALRGETIDAVITGSSLSGASAVTFSGTGVTADVGPVTDDQVSITIAISATARGTRTFTIQTPQGNVNSSSFGVTFTVIGFIPTITPTIVPTIRPTIVPTFQPTLRPTIVPTFRPTGPFPTARPTVVPITRPTFAPIIPSTIRFTPLSTTSVVAAQPVNTVPGIGPTFGSRLESGGIARVGDLATAQPAQVARLLGISEVRAMGFIDEARRLQAQLLELNHMSLGKVSVVIPSYNEGENLVDTVRCVLDHASYEDFEVLVVDDGSTDGSGDRVSRFLGSNGQMQVLRTPGLGVAGARNWGAQAARGDILIFLDAHS